MLVPVRGCDDDGGRRRQRDGFDKLVSQTATHSGIFIGGGGVEAHFDTGLHQLQVDLNGDSVLDTGDLAVDGASLATLNAHGLLFVYFRPPRLPPLPVTGRGGNEGWRLEPDFVDGVAPLPSIDS